MLEIHPSLRVVRIEYTNAPDGSRSADRPRASVGETTRENDGAEPGASFDWRTIGGRP